MKTLPEKWTVHAVTKEQDEVIREYINKEYNQDLNDFFPDEGFWYFNFESGVRNNYFSKRVPDSAQEISFEEFKWWVLGEFPEKWYCRYKSEEEFNIADKFFNHYWGYIDNGNFCSDKDSNHWWYSQREDPQYIEISFEDFKKHVLKETPEEKNKYGIEVGDSLEIISTYKVTSVSSTGIVIESSPYNWETVNSRLDSKSWTLIKKPKMYKLEELLSEEIVVFIETKEQWQKLKDTGLFDLTRSFMGAYCYNLSEGSYTSSSSKTYVGNSYKEKGKTTIVQFNQIKFKEMEKQIIGYKLKEGCKSYRIAAEKICGFSNPKDEEEYFNNYFATKISPDGGFVTTLKEAGVLDIWFEPIYKKEEEFKVGDVVKCISGFTSRGCSSGEEARRNNYGGAVYREGKIFQIDRVTDSTSVLWEKDSGYGVYSFAVELASPEETKEYENNLLLKEAKAKYPIGTRFFPAHMDLNSVSDKGKFCAVTNSNFKLDGGDIFALTDEGKCYTNPDGKHGNTTWNRLVYHQGKWAQILPSFPQIEIKNYTAKFSENSVKFGCQEYSKEFILKLNECLQVNGFKMDYKDDIQKMAQYFQNKEK